MLSDNGISAARADEASLPAPVAELLAQQVIEFQPDVVALARAAAANSLQKALYAEADVGDAIPEAYYEAISKILAHVAKIDRRVAEKYAAMGR